MQTTIKTVITDPAANHSPTKVDVAADSIALLWAEDEVTTAQYEAAKAYQHDRDIIAGRARQPFRDALDYSVWRNPVAGDGRFEGDIRFHQASKRLRAVRSMLKRPAVLLLHLALRGFDVRLEKLWPVLSKLADFYSRENEFRFADRYRDFDNHQNWQLPYANLETRIP
jgi:hypothetical protein